MFGHKSAWETGVKRGHGLMTVCSKGNYILLLSDAGGTSLVCVCYKRTRRKWNLSIPPHLLLSLLNVEICQAV